MFFYSSIAKGQTTFKFSEKGLSPESVTTTIEGLSKTELYNKTLAWIENTYKNADKVIQSKSGDSLINFIHIKDNAVNIDKIYSSIKYSITISFEDGQYKFEPTAIQTKVNSKYDRGWNDFNLKNGETFYKRGKLIKKSKSFVINIPDILNQLYASLNAYLSEM